MESVARRSILERMPPQQRDKPIAREKFAGSEIAIQGNGDYQVDTSTAESGGQRFRLPEGARLSIDIGGTHALEIYKENGTLRIDLGAGATERVVLGDALMSMLNEFFKSYESHTHPTKMGPTGPPLEHFTGHHFSEDLLSDAVKTRKNA